MKSFMHAEKEKCVERFFLFIIVTATRTKILNHKTKGAKEPGRRIVFRNKKCEWIFSSNFCPQTKLSQAAKCKQVLYRRSANLMPH